MVSMQKAQTGARVYMGVRQAPNRGQVSAKGANGYIQREMRNKRASGVVTPVGGDGNSDNRSTVAARALQRRGVGQTVGTGGPKTLPGSDPWKRKTGGPRPPLPENPQDPNGDTGVQVPAVKVNDSGLLELPYNQEFSLDQYNALRDANEQLLGLKVEADQQNMEYGQAKRDTELAYRQQQQQTLNENAAGGTVFSSRYGTGVANNATQFANQMGDLDQQNTLFQQNQALQQAAIQNALNQQLGLGVQGYVNELGNEAGNLGYGTNKQKVSPGQNNSVYGPNARHRKNKGNNGKGHKRGQGRKDGHKRGSGKGPDSKWVDAAKRKMQKKGK